MNVKTSLHETNPVSFYYRKDLQVTKHGEFIAGEDLMMGDIVKVDIATGLVTKADATDAMGIVDHIIYNVQGPDTLEIKEGERVRVGIGHDVEIVTKGCHEGLDGLAKGAKLTVADGKLVAGEGYAQVIEVFANGEVVVRIPHTEA